MGLQNVLENWYNCHVSFALSEQKFNSSLQLLIGFLVRWRVFLCFFFFLFVCWRNCSFVGSTSPVNWKCNGGWCRRPPRLKRTKKHAGGENSKKNCFSSAFFNASRCVYIANFFNGITLSAVWYSSDGLTVAFLIRNCGRKMCYIMWKLYYGTIKTDVLWNYGTF